MKNYSITSAVDVLTAKEWSSFDRVSFSKKINWYKNRKRLTDKIATDSNNMLIMATSAINRSRRGVRSFPRLLLFFHKVDSRCDLSS